MPDNIDKTRSERTGLLTFTGSGVAQIPDVMEESKDLRQMIQDMINEALSNVTGATIIQDVPDQITYQFGGGGSNQSELNNAITNMTDLMYDELTGLWNRLSSVFSQIQQVRTDLQDQINNLESGTGGGGKWFILTSAGTPLKGTMQGGDVQEEDVSIEIHPDSESGNYHSGGYVFAAQLDGKWTSVNFFSDSLAFIGNQLDNC